MNHSTAQSLASTIGVVFLVIGILGFVPGVTSDFDRLEFAGHASAAELFGVFDVSILHNLLHVALGVAGMLLARTGERARAYLLGGGVAYLALWLFGLLVDRGDEANLIPLDSAGNWLHLALGLTMVAGAVLTSSRSIARPAPTR